MTEADTFRNELVPIEGTHGRIWELASNTNYIVRHENSVTIQAISRTLEQLSETRTLLGELEADYGIKNPGYSPVITGDNGKTGMQPVVVTSRVHGVGLPEAIAKGVPGVLDAVDELYSNLAKYLQDKSKSGQRFMVDIFSSYQYMYGRTEANAEATIYLIDIGAEVGGSDNTAYTPFPGLVSKWNADELVSVATNLYEEITDTTEKTGKHFKAYDDVIALLNIIPVENPNAAELIALINQAHAHGSVVPKRRLDELTELL